MIARIFLILIPVFLVTGIPAGIAQESRKPSAAAVRRLETVKQQFTLMEWAKALEGVDRLTDGYPAWQEAWLLRAAISEEMGLLDIELESLETAILIDSQSCPGCFLRLAELEYRKGRYQEAYVNLTRHHQNHPDQLNTNAETLRLGSSIRFAMDQVSRWPQAEIERLDEPVNTASDEYFPSLTIDGAILAFTRQDWIIEGAERRPGQEDLYRVEWDGEGGRRPEAFPPPVSTEGNEGTMSLSQDGRIMLFTACGRRDTKGSCDLYIAYKSGTEWLSPVNMGYPVNTRYWESTPFLASDGRTLYFSSNRPGGLGGMDLWYSKMGRDGSWEQPVNLGEPVNTTGNELSPFMLPDGSHLFFASDGHAGMGGLDLYRSQNDGVAGWSEPVNLGYPVNTHFDEDALTMPGSAAFALFASNRDTAGGKDIYRFIPADSIRPPRSVIVRGTVRNRLTRQPLRAAIEISATEIAGTSRVESDDRSGEFLMGMPVSRLYRVNIVAPGYLLHSDQIDGDTLTRYQVIEKEYLLDPIQVGSSIILRNIFFETDSFALLPASSGELAELIRLVRENPGMAIEIGGHTDSTGSVEYNTELSLRRAESVLKHLIGNGIAPERLTIRGYGATLPVAENETAEGRALNRRTEIRILKIN
ncbi:MAG: OmpA family protein [Bacteroidales bacterium]